MLDMRDIRKREDEVRANLRDRNISLDFDALLAADREERETTVELDAVRQRRNEIANSMKNLASQDQRAPLIEEGRALKERESELEQRCQEAGERRKSLQTQVPNFSHPDSPIVITGAP